MPQAELKINYVPIGDIEPYTNNTRVHSDQQIDQIVKSIKEFGMVNPIGIHSGTIVFGHGRYEALKLLNYETVPTIDLSHMTEDQMKAYVITDNKIGDNSYFDEELLKLEIEALYEAGYDIDVLGFDEIELMDLGFEDIDDAVKELPRELEDDLPEIPDIPVIKYGDIIELGRNFQHRLMCGDSTKKDDVKQLQIADLTEKTVHCISDPPYGIAYNPETTKYNMIKNDDVFLDYIGLAKKYTNGFFFMWTGYQVVHEWVLRIKRDFDKINNMIIWHKGGGSLGDCKRTLSTDFEIALVVNRGNPIQSKRIGSVWGYQADKKMQVAKKSSKPELLKIMKQLVDGEVVWKVGKDHTNTYLHPTQKPVEVNMKALEHFTAKDDIILDLFLGSGSNLIACENMERRLFGMELDETYAQIVIQRYCDYTSNTTIRINGKEVDWENYRDA